MSAADDERNVLRLLLAAAQSEAAPTELAERVLSHIEYRSRLEGSPSRVAAVPRRRALLVASAALAAAAVLASVRYLSYAGAPIAAEQARAGSSRAEQPAGPAPRATLAASAGPADPCREHARAPGSEPLIDDFEDGDDAIAPLEQRLGFWRWAREIDAPGSAPALIPQPRPGQRTKSKLALHVRGGRLLDWGATLEFDFRPPCYDASVYAGIRFQARGPGRLYVAPREVSVIPIAEGGSCAEDCHNPHVMKIDLDAQWRSYEVRWADLRQRGFGKSPLDPKRLNSLAFLVRPEDTPYDLWLDDVRFLVDAR